MLVFSLAVVNLLKVTTTLKKWEEKEKKRKKRRGGEKKGKKEGEKTNKQKSTPPPKKNKKKKEKGEEKKKKKKRWWRFVFRLQRTIIVFWWVCKITVSLHSTFVTASVALIILILLALWNWDIAVETGQVCPFKIRCLQCASVFWSVLHCLFLIDHVEDVPCLLKDFMRWWVLSACFTADGSPLTVSQKNFSLLKMSLVARDANNKAGPHWETGWCALSGECTASLGWPWGVCQLVSGEPAQLHLMMVA